MIYRAKIMFHNVEDGILCPRLRKTEITSERQLRNTGLNISITSKNFGTTQLLESMQAEDFVSTGGRVVVTGKP